MIILRFFAAHSDEIVSRESLINGLWGISYSGTTRTIDTHVSCLRQKLGADGARIKTVYGAVYRYRKYPRPQHIPASYENKSQETKSLWRFPLPFSGA